MRPEQLAECARALYVAGLPSAPFAYPRVCARLAAAALSQAERPHPPEPRSPRERRVSGAHTLRRDAITRLMQAAARESAARGLLERAEVRAVLLELGFAAAARWLAALEADASGARRASAKSTAPEHLPPPPPAAPGGPRRVSLARFAAWVRLCETALAHAGVAGLLAGTPLWRALGEPLLVEDVAFPR